MCLLLHLLPAFFVCLSVVDLYFLVIFTATGCPQFIIGIVNMVGVVAGVARERARTCIIDVDWHRSVWRRPRHSRRQWWQMLSALTYFLMFSMNNSLSFYFYSNNNPLLWVWWFHCSDQISGLIGLNDATGGGHLREMTDLASQWHIANSWANWSDLDCANLREKWCDHAPNCCSHFLLINT